MHVTCDALQTWNDYTPEFFFIVVLISSPLTLLVALWGMTTDRMRQVCRERVRLMTSVKYVLLAACGV